MTTARASKPTARKDIHQHVTDTIIAQLETGMIPWQKPWNGAGDRLLALPKNFTTQNWYRGVNVILLWGSAIHHNFNSDEWGSYLQWQNKKEQVRRDEKGTMIVYYDTQEKQNQDGELEKFPFLKTSYVFNKCQLASYEAKTNEFVTNTKSLVERIDRAEEFVANTKAVIKHEGFGACYMQHSDLIYMPEPSSFIDTQNCSATEGYYDTLFHELSHWTGHESRLKRTFGRKFGDRQYSEEELTAELASAFICARLEITQKPQVNHASYIAHWLNVLQADKRLIFAAASDASRAVDYLYGLQPRSTTSIQP